MGKRTLDRAFVWARGGAAPRALTLPKGCDEVEATALNSRGDVVGIARGPRRVPVAVVWRGGGAPEAIPLSEASARPSERPPAPGSGPRDRWEAEAPVLITERGWIVGHEGTAQSPFALTTLCIGPRAVPLARAVAGDPAFGKGGLDWDGVSLAEDGAGLVANWGLVWYRLSPRG